MHFKSNLKTNSMNKLFLVIVAALFSLASCNNSTTNTEEDATKDSLKVAKITVADFLKTPEKFFGKEISISGTVSHTCMHSGKRMFIFDENPEETVKIEAGESIAKFEATLEGNDVEITGKVVENFRIDDEYLNTWEAEVIADTSQVHCDSEAKAIDAQTGEGIDTTARKADDPKAETLAEIEKYRKEIKENGNGYIPVYGITCIEFKIKE